jgi:hypothetical protein
MAEFVCPITGIRLPMPTAAEIKAQAVDLTDGIDASKADGAAPFIAGFFPTEAPFVAACKAARAEGFTNLQAWSPYAVHGLDPVLGLQRSLIGRPVFTVALLGFVACMAFQFGLMVVDWPTIYGGKPYYTWMLWVVPMLEAGLLFGAGLNLLLVFATCRLLPDPATTLPDPRLSDDLFALAISTQHRDAAALVAWFQSNGAERIQEISAVHAKAQPVFLPWREPTPIKAQPVVVGEEHGHG